MVITLLRPNLRKKNYQWLADEVSAIEPPIFMALRASQLIKDGYEVNIVDEELGCGEIGDNVEIFPNGLHPSAFIPQKEGLDTLVKDLSNRKSVKVWEKIPLFDIELSPSWDLFDLNRYRCHNWQAWGGLNRKPYGVIFTSIGCPFACTFCCIKEYYRNKYCENSINNIVNQIKYFISKGIRNIRFIDEIFFLGERRVNLICDEIIKLGCNDLNIWVYGRVDTIKPEILEKVRKAGIRWICLGIESGNENIRNSVSKGKFTNRNILNLVSSMKDNGISVLGNYIFGFPDDNEDTLWDTFNLAEKLNCEYSNFYTMMAYPGTEIEMIAKNNGWELPKNWSGYSQYSKDCTPVRTKYLTSKQVLEFRDKSFVNYHTSRKYLEMIKDKFGLNTVNEIVDLCLKKITRQ